MVTLTDMDKALRAVASSMGVDYDELLTEQGQAQLWASDDGFAVAREHLKAGIPKRPKSIKALENLSSMCVFLIKGAAEQKLSITIVNSDGDEVTIGIRGHLEALFYLDAVNEGLEGDELLASASA